MRVLKVKILLAFLLASTVGLFLWSPKNPQLNVTETRLKLIRDLTHLYIPVSAELLQFEEADRIIDPVWVAKLTLPKEELGMFESRLNAKKQEYKAPSWTLSATTKWWQPKNILISKRFWENESTLVTVIVSDERDGRLTLFIECSIV